METAVERAGERYAWIVFLVLGLGAAGGGIAIVAAGLPVNPPSAEGLTGLTLDQIAAQVPGMDAYVSGLARQLGNFMIAMGVLLMAIAAVPFRRGERWAWYACWIMPVLVIIQLTNSFAIYDFASGGFLWQLDVAALLFALAGLLLPYRTFFPRSQAAA